MKKFISFFIALCLMCACLSVAGCGKKIARVRRPVSYSYGYSYSFPYLTSSTSSSSNGKVSRVPENSDSVSEDDGLPAPMTTAEGVVHAINSIGEVVKEDYLAYEQVIESVETYYQNLTQSEKVKVLNIETLRKARADFEKYLTEDATKAVQKFVETMNSMPEFVYNEEYKTLVNRAIDEYNRIHARFKEEVGAEYEKLVSVSEKVFDYDKMTAVLTLYENLPNAISTATVGEYKNVVRNFNMLTSAQKDLLSDEVKNNIINYAKEIAVSFSALYRTVFALGISDDMFSVNANIQAISTPYDYNGEALSTCAVCDRNSKVIVFTPYGGELTLFLKGDGEISLYKGSAKEQSIAVTGNKATFFLDSLTTYSITFSGNVNLFAIEFN